MMRLFLERLIIFLFFCFVCFASASNIKQKIENIEAEFVPKIDILMEKYNYEKYEFQLLDDSGLRYKKNNDSFSFDYTITVDGIKKINFLGTIYLNVDDDLNSISNFVNDLFILSNSNISISSDEVENLIDELNSIGQYQKLSKTDSKGRLSLEVRKSTFFENDYELRLSFATYY